MKTLPISADGYRELNELRAIKASRTKNCSTHAILSTYVSNFCMLDADHKGDETCDNQCRALEQLLVELLDLSTMISQCRYQVSVDHASTSPLKA